MAAEIFHKNSRAAPASWPCDPNGRACGPAQAGQVLAVPPDSTIDATGRELIADGSQSLVLHRLAELASRLATIDPPAIDDAIAVGLRNLAESWKVDRAILWLEAPNEPGGVQFHQSAGDPCEPPSQPLDLAAVPWVAFRLEAGQAAWFTRLEQLPDPEDREALQKLGFRSAAIVPVSSGHGARPARGGLAFGSTVREHRWTTETIDQLRIVSAILGEALARKTTMEALERALDELDAARDRLVEQDVQSLPNVRVFRASDAHERLRVSNPYPRRETYSQADAQMIVGTSPAIRRVLEQARQVAATDSTVLLLGETGTGKELIATHIHGLSSRRARTMVRVNCAAIPATLIESELFGREKGAYTGALARQVGRFELASGATIFLDEIGDLPVEVQVKLLRVLEERQIERLGSPRAISVNVRIIAATHRNLENRIAEGAFREDLFYRLNVFPIQVPPLRERREDIPPLVWGFVDEFSNTFGKRVETIPMENMAALQQYAWPGNIRELRNVVERAMIVAAGAELTVPLPRPSLPSGSRSVRMTDVEREHVRGVLESTRWRIRGPDGAADRLGLRPTTLETRMAKLGIVRPKPA